MYQNIVNTSEGPTTVGQYLVDRLYEVGLRHLFSIPGDYTLEWVNSYVVPTKGSEKEIQVISEVNELNAAYAADGYARHKGQDGIAALCVTYSAGALSAANPIAGAYVERSPVVLINGAPSLARTLTFEQTGLTAHHFISGRQTNLQVFEYITAAAVRIDSPQMAPMLIDYALTQCITERQPVYIELLEDMINLKCPAPQGKLTPTKDMSNAANLEKAIGMVKEKLQTANNPIIWLGVEVDRYGLEKEAEALIKALNIPFVTQLMSKAVLSEDHPNFAGVFDGKASAQSVQDLVTGSEFILALGVWLTDLNTLGWPPDVDKTAFISLDTVKFGSYFGAQVSLQHFIDALLAVNISPINETLPEIPVLPSPEIDLDSTITYQGFYDFIPKFITDKTIVGSDASLNYFGTILLKTPAAGGYFAQADYSSIGFAGAAATGVCLAKEEDQRVMVFTGDGGFQMTAFCVVTQTRYKLNPVIFVMDNRVFAVEQWLARGATSVFSDGANFESGLEVYPCAYSKLKDVVGCEGWKVTTYRELEDAINGALANLTSPSIIQVVLPEKSILENAKWKTA